jgi:hypothetical protein
LELEAEREGARMNQQTNTEGSDMAEGTNNLLDLDAEDLAATEALGNMESELLAKDWADFRPHSMRPELAVVRTWGLYVWLGLYAERLSGQLFTLDEAVAAAEEYNRARQQPACGVGLVLLDRWAAVIINFAGQGCSDHMRALSGAAHRCRAYSEIHDHGSVTDFKTAVWLGKLKPGAKVHEFEGPTVRVMVGGGESPAIIPLRGDGQQLNVPKWRTEPRYVELAGPPPLIGDITEMAQSALLYAGSIAEHERRALGYEDAESSNAPEAPKAPPAQPKRKLTRKQRDAFAALKVLADGKPQRPDGGIELSQSAVVRALKAAGLSKQTSGRARDEFVELGALVEASDGSWVFHEAAL